ncbi:glycine cleavage system aminomethyltransferase GcvT [Micromonospora sp. LOL_024]|uniref:glycine cleavage system aminomethyltransferase GcvT n=1 Tax=Micromonospora sp. LOL_024 TaxID=3345412 RepID=UPI003A86328A
MPEPVALASPLARVHARVGATFTTFGGWRMPLRYAGHLAEHHAVRTAAGLFDLSHMGELVVDGLQAAAFLDYALVLDATGMEVGRARYTLICDERGGVLDDLLVYRVAEQEFLVVANASNVGLVHDALLARLGGHEAGLRDASAEYALLAVQGPRAAAVLGPLAGVDLAGIRRYRCATSTVAGRPALLGRTGYTGEDGFELYLAPADAQVVWDAVLAAGAPHGLVPAGLACRDTLRLEAGMALYGHELTPAVTPFQARLGWTVRLNKACGFVGRAALEASAADPRGSVLVGLTGTGRRAAREGSRVLDPASGEAVGTVTSGVLSPTLRHPIALAYVEPAYAAAGTDVDVDVRGSVSRYQVVEPPFYRPPTKPAETG